ncbi:hypothetical protein DPEC_G00214210 [Dallia pectoralis]|uniref:Uncharacterized protein n=1 Tax=Dallia pectoralis TaxID=75939 RepID=A0ACC2G2B0_DALPE|nr:hypothetical protein DPEC_G00214210 [Dallia pectoralis]
MLSFPSVRRLFPVCQANRLTLVWSASEAKPGHLPQAIPGTPVGLSEHPLKNQNHLTTLTVAGNGSQHQGAAFQRRNRRRCNEMGRCVQSTAGFNPTQEE